MVAVFMLNGSCVNVFQGKRSSSRRQHADKTPQKAPDKTQQSNSNTRRSSRLRKKPEPPPLPSPYNRYIGQLKDKLK